MAPVEERTVDPAKTRKTATQLDFLLEEFNSGATDFVEANREALQAQFPGDVWAAFEKLLQGYAVADARTILEQAMRHLQTT